MAKILKAAAVAEIQRQFPENCLDDKILMHWAKDGRECEIFKEKNRICFDSELFDKWLARLAGSLVVLDRDDYVKCFEFAVEAFYSSVTKADFNRSKQRDVGEFLTNQVRGKLGEIAVARLFEKRSISMQLDFSVTGQIPAQDIVQISTRKNIWNNTAAKVSIKATKYKNVLLTVTENEAKLADRKSDIYLLSQVGLFPDHILRILKGVVGELSPKLPKMIPDFGPIPARVAGWATYDQLIARPALSGAESESEYGIRFSSKNHIMRTAELSTDWEKLTAMIVGS
jgi:hypothetical protein